MRCDAAGEGEEEKRMSEKTKTAIYTHLEYYGCPRAGDSSTLE